MSSGVDVAMFQRLLEPVGQRLLREIQGSDNDALTLGTRLRRQYEPELVTAAMSQADLRVRARAKFGDDAAAMWFTPDGLKQATRASVSEYRARRLARSGATSITDLGCGIGGDLIAFARAGLDVRGVDADPLRAAIARANLQALGLDGRIVVGAAEDTELTSSDAVFCDPTRRNARGRIFDLDHMSPPWDTVAPLLTGRAVVKTFPGIAHADVPDDVEAEWISDGGDLVEACLWGTPLAMTSRRATVLDSTLPNPTSAASIPARDESPHVADVASWLAEPDDAVIRAGLVAELATDLGAHLIDPHLAYLSGGDPAPTPFARWFRVIDELPFGEKRLRAALVERDIGTLTVKKRGVDVVPEHLIRRLRLRGERDGTLILARIGAGARAFLVEPR